MQGIKNRWCSSKKPGGGTRIEYVDSLKGLAILCVVLGHVVQGYIEGTTYPEANQTFYWLHNVIYAFHMPLFMMISGYVYAVAYYENNEPDRRRIIKQVVNIAVVYVLYSVSFGLCKIAFQCYTVNETSLRDILLVWAKPIKLYWYLYDLALFYLLFSISSFYKASSRMILGVLAVVTVSSQYVRFEWFEVSRCMYYAVFFYIGISNKKHPNKLLGNKATAILSCVMSIILCAVFWDRNPYNRIETHIELHSIPVANAMIAFGISMFLWYLFQNVKQLSGNRILIMIGRCSLEIYVIHGVISPAFRALVSHIGFIGPYVALIVNSMLCIVIPMVFSLFCKKVGIWEILFKPTSALSKIKSG